MNFEGKKRHIRAIAEQIGGNADAIAKRIDLRYGILGGYTEAEIKEVFNSLNSINKRLLKIRMNL